jgi:hypothetical protein
MKLKAVHFLILLGLLFSAQLEARFPEFGFCPLGGPPGWFNRISGQSHRYYPPPPYPVRAPYMPYRTYTYPAQQFRPQFIQQNPNLANHR